MPKTSKKEYEDRIFQVQGWIVEGIQSSMIIKQILANGWCDQRQAERLLREARSRWVVNLTDDMTEKRAVKVAELQQLRRKLEKRYQGTPTGILAILAIEKQIIQLEGLNAPTKHLLQGDPDKPIKTEATTPVTLNVASLPDDVLMAIANARVSH